MSDLEVHFSSKEIEWGTPPDVIALIRESYPLTLDVCASPGRQVAPAYFAPVQDGSSGRILIGTPLDPVTKTGIAAFDGLIQDWAGWLRYLGGVAFMNPPFGKMIKHWIKKAHDESLRGACVVCLIPARTDTKFWHAFVEPVRLGEIPGELVFWKGRMSFTDASGNVGAPAPFPCALVVFGKVP